MLLILVLFFIFTILLSGITTIPFAISLLVVNMVIFKKPWIFFAAFGLGLFLDLLDLRNIGYTSLILAIFVFVIWLYERKFETQTISFVFIATFFGSIIYLMVFGYHMVFLQAFINALVAVVIFRVIPNLFRDPTLNKTEMLK